jgi:DNA-binding Lrp family transcriptional regulator
LSSATTILADNFISSLCDENRNIPWFWLLNITCRSTPFVFETVEASWSSEKANIGGNGRILKLVSNESDIPVDKEGDRTTLRDDIYSKARSSLPTQQTLLSDGIDGNESFAFNSSTLDELHDNDNKILLLLKGDADGDPSYTFNGLQRELNIHQQSLSRSIKRLIDLGLIEQIKHYGFRLTRLGRHLGMPASSLKISNKYRKYTQLAYLDMHFTKFDIDRITSKLSGKWFENLRWVGKINDSGVSTMKWKRFDNSFGINVTIMQGSLTIESDATLQKEIMEAARTIPKIISMVTDVILEQFKSLPPSNNYLSMSRMYYGVNRAWYN